MYSYLLIEQEEKYTKLISYISNPQKLNIDKVKNILKIVTKEVSAITNYKIEIDSLFKLSTDFKKALEKTSVNINEEEKISPSEEEKTSFTGKLKSFVHKIVNSAKISEEIKNDTTKQVEEIIEKEISTAYPVLAKNNINFSANLRLNNRPMTKLQKIRDVSIYHQQKNAELEERIKQMEKELDYNSRIIDTITQELSKDTSSYLTMNKFHQILSQLESNLQTKVAEVGQFQKSLFIAQRTINQQKKELEQLKQQKQLAELELKRMKIKNVEKDLEINVLNDHVKELDKQIEKLHGVIDRKMDIIANISKKMDDVEESYQDMREKIEKLKEDFLDHAKRGFIWTIIIVIANILFRIVYGKITNNYARLSLLQKVKETYNLIKQDGLTGLNLILVLLLLIIFAAIFYIARSVWKSYELIKHKLDIMLSSRITPEVYY